MNDFSCGLSFKLIYKTLKEDNRYKKNILSDEKLKFYNLALD